MRPLKRVLVFVMEVGIVVLGYVLTVVAAVYLESVLAVMVGLTLTITCLVLVRRRTRKWKIASDATAFTADSIFRKAHPSRAKYLRTMRRLLLVFPTTWAALVLFFFPVASHVVYPGTHLVPHYRISTPINWTLISGGDGRRTMVWAFFSGKGSRRWGLTPFWSERSALSSAIFGTSSPEDEYRWWHPVTETAITKTSFKMGSIEIECGEYQRHFSSSVDPPLLWEVLCSTHPDHRHFNLHAAFLGHKEDMASFYRVLHEGAPID
jgi:hypothetical protein